VENSQKKKKKTNAPPDWHPVANCGRSEQAKKIPFAMAVGRARLRMVCPCAQSSAPKRNLLPLSHKMGGRSCLNLLPCSTSTPCRASAAASSCRYFVHHHRTRARVQASTGRRGAAKVSCSAASGQAPPSQSTIKVAHPGEWGS
jgi:hypothetical protein